MARKNTLGVRLDDDVYDELQHVAVETERSMSYLADIAIKEWLRKRRATPSGNGNGNGNGKKVSLTR